MGKEGEGRKLFGSAYDDHGVSSLQFIGADGIDIIGRSEPSETRYDSKDKHRQTPLLWAAGNGHEVIVKLLLDIGKVDVDSKGKDGQTPLLWAAAYDREAVVKLLLDSGVDTTVAANAGRTPVHYAAAQGHLEIIRLLYTKQYASLSATDILRRPPTFYAIRLGRKNIFHFILEIRSAAVNRTDYYGLTMLSIAARFVYYIIVQQLLNFPEIGVCIADKFGRTAITWAQSLGYEGIVGSISQHCPCQDACATQAAIPNARRDLSTGSNSFCDVCWADLREIWYNCNTCFGGFTICPDCRELVAHCLEESYGLNRVNKD